METRALCLSVFYAIGTGIGGITGPLLFSALITTGKTSQAALALILGAVMMILGGIAEIAESERSVRGWRTSPSP
jgi:hypothetical protein